MALAEPALRQYGLRGLQNLRFRGGSLLGTAVGTAIGIGSYLLKDYDVVIPWNPMLQPDRGRRAVIGPSENVSAHQQHQTLRTSKYFDNRRRRNTKRHNKRRSRGSCCCC